MEDFKVFLYLLILLHVLPPSLAESPYECPISFCGSSAYSIQFPFRVVGQQQDMCGYPGFNLRCDKQGKLLLNLPNSGDFSVRAIDYRSQIVQVYDPSGCSAARRLTLDLSGSPFWGTQSKNYTLLSCPVETDMSNHISVGCISNSTHSTLATSSEHFAMTMANQTSCRIIGSITTPIAWWQDQGGLTSNLNMDLALTWNSPNCTECTARGVVCGYTNTTKQDITCFDNTKKSKTIFLTKTLFLLQIILDLTKNVS
ncbi:putative wall-associated receptor kinase, galacturonan-binding domain-containing protein [Helianthus debilis subsp. tardiflorus]